MVSHITQDFLVSGIAPKRIGNGGNCGGPADLIKCRDGIICMSAGTQDHWTRLCKLLARPELFADTRFDSNLSRFYNRTELLHECDLAAIPAALKMHWPKYSAIHECRGRAEIAQYVSAGLADFVSVHHGHTPEIVIESALRATGVWAMEDQLFWSAGHTSRVRKLHGYGHNHDGYVCREGRWLFESVILRRIRVDIE